MYSVPPMADVVPSSINVEIDATRVLLDTPTSMPNQDTHVKRSRGIDVDGQVSTKTEPSAIGAQLPKWWEDGTEDVSQSARGGASTIWARRGAGSASGRGRPRPVLCSRGGHLGTRRGDVQRPRP